jgi:Tol biopolymer transport system component
MRLVCAVIAGAFLLAAPAAAQSPAKPQTTSLDSEAPPGSPPHWLPNETWVMQHWLPFDEERLYSLLHSSRGEVWHWLRDDTRNLAGLARERGWQPEALARELVAPWRGKLSEPSRLALLRSRALRVLTQGHLSQHIFFHSLHQNAIPDNAPAIFGVGSREEFQTLRRSELSPLQICRLNGLSRSHAATSAEQTLRSILERGVRGQAIPQSQADRLLARQLRQLPRWLQQTRYNGPPPLKRPRASTATAANFSNNAVVSADGSRIAWEGYEAKLAIVKRRGEIAVVAAGPAGLERVSTPAAGLFETPHSAYNPAMSANGRWVAFEAAAGNLNFAKRYGEMQIFVRDLASGRTATISPGGVPASFYNPAISGDGRLVAYESSSSRGGALELLVSDRRRGTLARVPHPAGTSGDLSEPALSADGRVLAFTAVDGQGHSAVYVRDLGARRTARVSAAGQEAYEPALSRNGRLVAFTTGEGVTGVALADRSTGRTETIAPQYAAPQDEAQQEARRNADPQEGAGQEARAGSSGSAYEPSISADGARVAYSVRMPGRRTLVYVRDRAEGSTTLVSRASGVDGPAADGSSTHPAISGDGRSVAFTSDAWNLSPGKCNSARGVFVRDLARQTTRLVSKDDGANRWLGPTKGSSTSEDALVTMLCA